MVASANRGVVVPELPCVVAPEFAGASKPVDGRLPGSLIINPARQFRAVAFKQMAKHLLAHRMFSTGPGGNRMDHSIQMGLNLLGRLFLHTATPKMPPMPAANCRNSPRAPSSRRRPLAVR